MRILGASMSDNSELVAKSLALTPANHETRRGVGFIVGGVDRVAHIRCFTRYVRCLLFVLGAGLPGGSVGETRVLISCRVSLWRLEQPLGGAACLVV